MRNKSIIPVFLGLVLSVAVRAQLSDRSVPTLVKPGIENWWWYGLVLLIIGIVGYRIVQSLLQKLEDEKIISAFATSLYGQKTVEDIFWDSAKNCVEKMGFIDCVVYQLNPDRKLLLQMAAFGPKNPWKREIINRIEIPIGKGIVGTVALTGKAEIVKNTAADPRYIMDDERRLSEIAVPIWIDGQVFGVIDSENPRRNFYKKYHLRLLIKIAAITAERIAKYLAEEKLRSKIARDLHDEIGSTLTSINILSKVAMQELGSNDKTIQYLQKIKDNSANIMERMSDIVWAINPVNDNFDKVVLRMKEFAAEILEPAGINYYFKEEGTLDRTQLKLEHRKDIYLIFKEVVNNVVKYSKATELDVVVQKQHDRLRMSITDNGIGFNQETAHQGNGIRNMRDRAAGMQGSLNIHSIMDTGTTVVLEVGIT